MRAPSIVLALAAPLSVLAACGSSGGGSPASPADDAGGADGTVAADGSGPGADGGTGDGADAFVDPGGPLGGSRPVTLHVPPSYVAGTPMPLVLLLHGYSATGAGEETYLGFTSLSDSRGFLYAHPDGTTDASGLEFWNATDACCNLNGSTVDDSTYLSDLVKQISARYTVDAKRVFLIGHSNGAFMSYRMACDHGDQIAAIVSLAGAMWSDVSKCAAATPVSILEVHGTSDQTIPFAGGQIQGHSYPGATTTVGDWVTIDGCTATADTSAPPLDLESTLAGAETTVTKYAAGCKPGGAAELWTMQGAGHIPTFTAAFAPGAIDFLYAHKKP